MIRLPFKGPQSCRTKVEEAESIRKVWFPDRGNSQVLYGSHQVSVDGDGNTQLRFEGEFDLRVHASFDFDIHPKKQIFHLHVPFIAEFLSPPSVSFLAPKVLCVARAASVTNLGFNLEIVVPTAQSALRKTRVAWKVTGAPASKPALLLRDAMFRPELPESVPRLQRAS